MWCWRRLLRVPWTARRSNQSILKESNREYSLEGLMLKLKLQYFDHMLQKGDSLEKTLMLGKIEGRRKRGWQRMRKLDDITDSMDMSLHKLQRSLACCSPWACKDSDMTKRMNNNNNPYSNFHLGWVCLMSPPCLIPCGLPLRPTLFKTKKTPCHFLLWCSLFSLISAFLLSDYKLLKGMNHHMLPNKYDFYGSKKYSLRWARPVLLWGEARWCISAGGRSGSPQGS